jgi:predicted nucleic acid-binding protein
MKPCLIDTGPFVAYLNRSDPTHEVVATFVDTFKGELVTTGAVIGEVMYFVSERASGPISFAKFLLGSGVRIVDSTRPQQVLAAAELMSKYSDTPMDFADATLVLLAEEVGVTEILTLDRRGFSTYRTAKGKGFRLILTASKAKSRS